MDEEEDEIEALNLGIIAAYYYIQYTTIHILATSLTAKTKLKGLLEIISAASEFDDLPMRPGVPAHYTSDLPLSRGASAGHARAVHASSELA